VALSERGQAWSWWYAGGTFFGGIGCALAYFDLHGEPWRTSVLLAALIAVFLGLVLAPWRAGRSRMEQKGEANCLCGGRLKVRAEGGDAGKAVKDLSTVFWEVHSGEGHGPVSASESARARRRKNRRRRGE
jgi:MFS family permease